MNAIQSYFRDIYDCYLTAMKGLNVTIRVMIENPITAQYPDEPTGVTPMFRGLHDFHHDACNGCGLCAKRCPVECIAVEKVGKGKDAVVTHYVIDYTKCLFCSLCCEACPKDAITMGKEWYLKAASRDDCVKEFVVESELPEWVRNGGSPEEAKGESGAGKVPAEAQSAEGAAG